MAVRLTVALAAVFALSACEQHEIDAWLGWHAQEPEAAMEFAMLPEIQQALTAGARAVRVSAPEQPVGGGTVWDRLAQCESGGNWAINTGNGYFGGLQFLASTWRANGGTGLPHQNSREEQIRVAENLRSKSGYAPWPACSRKLGLR